MTQLHGGDIDTAMRQYGGTTDDWLDLSTGINRIPYPLPNITPSAWSSLPTVAEIEALKKAAEKAYMTDAAIVPLPGAQAAIQILPHLFAPGVVRILTPTYGEYAPAFACCAWRVETVEALEKLEGADVAILANPNNPDGRTHTPDELRSLCERVGTLIVDESFADPTPGQSLAKGTINENAIVLRSFGKFYGLAGLRLGFALTSPALAHKIARLAGPWPVSGPAISIGKTALADTTWRKATITRVQGDVQRLDTLVKAASWTLEGGTFLFRLYRTEDAELAKDLLARARIWSRTFKGTRHWLRLGIPGLENEWQRLEQALQTTSVKSVVR